MDEYFYRLNRLNGYFYLDHSIRINLKLFLSLGEPINQRDARFIPLSNVLESLNDADTV